MGRKTAAFFLLLSIAFVFPALGLGADSVPMAVAQTICPPGQELDPQTSRCVAIKCPPDETFDPQTSRCAPVSCLQGEALDPQTNRCIPAKCLLGEVLDPQTSHCLPIKCAPGQELDPRTSRCLRRPIPIPIMFVAAAIMIAGFLGFTARGWWRRRHRPPPVRVLLGQDPGRARMVAQDQVPAKARVGIRLGVGVSAATLRPISRIG
jgi:hypothetical protein